jgi:hypothetical protein
MMQTKSPFVDPALRAAMHVLKQRANPIATGPGGAPTKSVVGSLMDEVDTPPTGMQSTGGEGLQGVLANLQNAAPTLQQNAQNAQADQIASMAAAKIQGQGQGGGQPQMMAQGGIAKGDEDLNFAEGGILGFAGPDGSEVLTEPLSAPDPGGGGEGVNARTLRALWESITSKMMGDPGSVMLPGGESGAERNARLAKEREAERDYSEYTDPDRARLDVPAPPAAKPGAAKPGAAKPPAAGAPSGGGMGGGLPDIAKLMEAIYKAQGENPDLAEARAAEKESSAALRNQRPPGQEELEIRRRAEEKRQKLYAEEDASAPMRQLQKLLQGIHMMGLGGGAQAVSQFQDNEARKRAERITEEEFNAAKRQAILDGQEALRVGNLGKVAENKEKLATLNMHERKLKSDMFSHVYGALVGYAGHIGAANISAAASRDAGISRLMAAMMKPQGGKMSAKDALQLKSYEETHFTGPQANTSPVLKEYLAKLNSPGAKQLLSDIENGRAKFDPKTGWGKAAPMVQQARDLMRREFLGSVGPIEQAGDVRSYDEALREFGG